MSRVPLFSLLVIVAAAGQAQAQDHWGVSAGLTPSWQSGPPVAAIFGADDIDMRGSELNVGVVRGLLLGGDWGLSFVNKTIADDSTLAVDVADCSRGTCGTFYRTLERTHLTGVEFHEYRAFRTWMDRVQLGMVGSVGIGWLRGTVYKRSVTAEREQETFDADASELFPRSTAVVPLASLQLAVAGILAPGVKIRVAGGFSMPGYQKFGISVIYLLPQ